MGESTSTQPAPGDDAVSTPTATVPTATSTGIGACGQSGSLTLLLIGADVLGGSLPNGADAIRIVKVNFDNQTVKIVTIPRDLLIQTASVNDASMVTQKIGLTFHEAYTASTGTSIEKNAIGARVVAQLLLNSFNLQSDHYLTIQMDQFVKMIDTIGGVEINIPAAVTTDRNISYSAGLQTLNGALASEYIRFLNPGGEEGRTARQNAFIQALQDKVINIGILAHLPTLITQFKDALITDLSIEQLTSLACLSVNMNKSNITFGAITAPDLMVDNMPNIEKIKLYLTTFLGD